MATLDATLGGATSNSYVDLAEAVAIARNLQGGDQWVARTDDEKILSLIQATMWLETLEYVGTRCTAIQRLKWPRQGGSCDGVAADCTGIPYKIKEAEVLVAMQLAANPDAILGENSGNAPTGTFTKRQKLGDLEIEYAQFNNNYGTDCDNCDQPPLLQEYPWLQAILGCWIYVISSDSGRVLTRDCCPQYPLTPDTVRTQNLMDSPPYD
jgi:hypothetical protein